MFAIFIECTLKNGKVFEQDGGPVKFVNDEADAKAFCGNPDNEYLLKRYVGYKSVEFIYEEWGLAEFAEYCRERFEELNERLTSHIFGE